MCAHLGSSTWPQHVARLVMSAGVRVGRGSPFWFPLPSSRGSLYLLRFRQVIPGRTVCQVGESTLLCPWGRLCGVCLPHVRPWRRDHTQAPAGESCGQFARFPVEPCWISEHELGEQLCHHPEGASAAHAGETWRVGPVCMGGGHVIRGPGSRVGDKLR